MTSLTAASALAALPVPVFYPSFRPKSVRQPMFWAAIAHAGGIWAGVWMWRPPLWWVAAGCVFLAAAAYCAHRRAWLGWALALSGFFVLGALSIQARDSSIHFDNGIQPYADAHQPLEIIAHVIRDGRVQPGGFGETRQILEIETESITTADEHNAKIHSGVQLSIYSRPSSGEAEPNSSADGIHPSAYSMHAFHYGQRIRFTTKLKTPRNFRNPGAFDYEGYLSGRGIAGLGSAKSEDVELLPGFYGTRLEDWRSRMHRAVIRKVHELWPAREAALIDAMVIGEEAFIDRDTRVDFQRSGTYHVLVVSGMNVSILAFVIFWTLRRLRITEIPATLLTIGFCVAYAFITEVGAPVWRATLMCAVYLATRLIYRDRAMVNALGVAALGLLLFDPRQLFTASFQMTFLCVLIVAGIGIPILERTSQLYKRALANWDSPEYAALLPPRIAQFRVDLQMITARVALFIGNNWARWLVRFLVRTCLTVWELVFVSAVMQMGLALPMAYYFHRATTIGLPANLLVVPLVQFLMPSALAALSLGCISLWLARIPALLTAVAVEAITGTVHGLGSARLADLRVPMPSILMIFLAASSLAFAVWAARRHRALAIGGLVGIFAASLFLAFPLASPSIHPGVLEVTSIDVGEGDSELIVTPQGRTLLVDAGGPIGPGGSQLDFGEDVVAPYLWTRGISHLDAVAITHGHSDHIGGMIAVLKNFKPKELWVGLLPPSYALEKVIATARALGVNVVRHWEGDEFSFGGTRIAVLVSAARLASRTKPQE